ncbi:LON peptidase substrate-binding domain-containing protein [Synoicihabitans lomoniglobus]|uniref:LON peptidase substrate-binding domain-containing protein n=1 Tax=Synoicihabitans lomoniglobus TaxID=2909285 RepID=A0AAE9ZXN9_9BACT|nr:LON peptidase substrate-binding domain-containing protein [Opitutaceae bacterium LMO-M01]WED63103.1 LON peptidase substrate-binding domain-containing protein [Opitutaceae bacterium LMO-M01]
METEIVVPDEIAVMTLPEVAFFPQALMPLHIFEPRYRQMLEHVLASHRIFAIAGLHPASDPTEERGQRIATAGIVRACNQNEDGTSNLLLQGLTRVECLDVVAEEPYRKIRIKALTSTSGEVGPESRRLRRRVERLISLKRQLGAAIPEGFSQFLRTVDDPETFVDLAAFTLCDSAQLKQQLLETLDVRERLELYGQALRTEIDTLSLYRKLQGGLDDDDIANN